MADVVKYDHSIFKQQLVIGKQLRKSPIRSGTTSTDATTTPSSSKSPANSNDDASRASSAVSATDGSSAEATAPEGSSSQEDWEEEAWEKDVNKHRAAVGRSAGYLLTAMTDMINQPDSAEAMNNKIINEEYKIWKKNSVFIYDILYSRALEWPTLTTQWLPDVKDVPGKPFRTHRFLFGTHTSGSTTDYLQFGHINIPKPPPRSLADYNATTEELGGFGAAKEPMNLEVPQKIVHPGEVNKARYQPQNPNVIATFSPDYNVYVWDRTKHDSVPKDDIAKPQATLQGHSGEGFALEWNPFVEGQLLSGSEDKTVKLWDLPRDFTLDNKTLKPARQFTHHSATVNDVQYHPVYGKNLFGSVSDDLTIQIMDLRSKSDSKPAILFENAHSDAINTLCFHPTLDKLLATGSADKTIGLFDLRFPKFGRIHSLEGHRDNVTKVDWHPTDDAILASSSDDRRTIFWDCSRQGMEQTPEDAEDGPPEMLFMHGGHTNRVSDFSWNKNDPWIMLSAGEDNLIQIWRAARNLVETLPPGVQRREVSE